MADVDLDDVRVALEVVVPDVLEDLGLAYGLAATPNEVLEERELPRRQLDLGVAATNASRGGVELQVAGGDDRRALACAPAQERPQPRDEHDVRERLCEVVVGAGVEG